MIGEYFLENLRSQNQKNKIINWHAKVYFKLQYVATGIRHWITFASWNQIRKV